MSVILLGALAFVQPEDASTYYGMDMNIACFSRYWERVYETSPSGFRTSQGCHDMRHWYQIYEAKAEVSLAGPFSLRYQFFMLRDYESSITKHRFEPSVRILRDLYLHLVAVPSYFKKEDEAGIGFAWRRDFTDWVAVYGVVQGFDHNLSLMYTPPGPENDSFMQIPYKFEVDARGELRWMRLRLHAELGTRSRQRLCWPDSSFYEWERDRDQSSAWGRIELEPFKDLWVGTRFAWSRDRTESRWPAQDLITADTVRDRYLKPSISFSPTERLELSCEYQIWRMARDMDSVSYRRDYDVLTTLMTWNPWPFVVFEAGYQRSWRGIYNNEALITEPYPYNGSLIQSRLLLNLEMRFRSGFMFTIKEGIEMDNFPRGTFEHPHNHTYISIYMPLAFVHEHGHSKD